MTRVTVIFVIAGLMAAVALLTVLAWLLYTTYLDRVERRLAARKGLYRDLVSGLSTRQRSLLHSTINDMKTLYDLDALEAVLEEQARSSTTRQDWLLAVYDELGLVDRYIAKLRTARKWRDRAFAAELLGRVGGAKAVPPLLETVQATRTEDADVREIALRALARIADPGAVAPLVQALSTADAWLVPRIADILARHGDAAVDPLIELLEQPSRHPARAWAANVLGEVSAQRAFPVLVRHLDDAEAEVRGKCATALGRLGDRRAIPPLLGHLLSDPAPFVRARIAGALGQFGGPEIIERLVQALGDTAWWVRIRSVEALEQIGPAAEGPLVLALDNSDSEIRARAAMALERLGVSQRIVRLVESDHPATEADELLVRLSAGGPPEFLGELLRNPSVRVREAALSAIDQAQRGEMAGALVETAASDPEPALRARAFDLLRALGIGDALTASVAGLADPDQRVRAAAVRLISELGGPEAIELLRARSSDSDGAVRAAAIRGLGSLRATVAEPDFLRLLGDPKPAVRESAIAAAAAAGLRSLVPSLIELLDDGEQSVRQAAVEALGELGDAAAVPPLVRAFAAAEPRERELITRAVGRLDAGAIPELVTALLQSADPMSHRAAARELGRMRARGSTDALIRLTRSPDAAVRAAALTSLGSSGAERDAVQQIVTASLQDPAETVRARAIELAARLDLRHETPTILALLRSDSSTTVRERAALATGLLQLPDGEEALSDIVIRDEPNEVRAAAALALACYQPVSLVSRVMGMPHAGSVRAQLRAALSRDPWYRLLARKIARVRRLELLALAAASPEAAQLALGDTMQQTVDPGERVKLVAGLGALQGEPSLAALHRAVREDPHPEVRAAALAAMGDRLDTEELLASGTRALGDPSLVVRRAAIDLFSRVTPARLFPRLIRSLHGEDDDALLAAAAKLAEAHFGDFRDAVNSMPLDRSQLNLVLRIARFVHHPELAQLLAPLASSSWPEVRESVAELWRRRPETIDSEALERLVEDPVLSVRLSAAGAAAADRRYDLLRRMVLDPVAGVRRQVAVALGRAAPVLPPGIAVLERLAADPEMPVRAAAYAARLAQGAPVPLPPGLEPRIAAEAVRDTLDLASLRVSARTTRSEDGRLAAGLALALLQDEVAREIARTDPIPAIRHRVGGALELAMASTGVE